MLDFFLEKNKRACPFIREVRVYFIFSISYRFYVITNFVFLSISGKPILRRKFISSLVDMKLINRQNKVDFVFLDTYFLAKQRQKKSKHIDLSNQK